MSLPLYTPNRNPSAAANVNLSPVISTFTPVSTGRESSVAAAIPTCLIASVNTFVSTLPATPESTVGIGGNSFAGAPFICAENRAHCTDIPTGCSVYRRSTRSAGSEFVNSVSSRAGTVTVPSSSICAPIHVLMAISWFVADNFNRALSVAINTFCMTGYVVRAGTALATNPSPRLRFSCKQESRILVCSQL